jgi:uncharacterized cofD-like protein
MRLKPPNLLKRIRRAGQSLIRWLTPGIGIKRWFLLVLIGTTIISLGIADVLLDIIRQPTRWGNLLYYLTLLFLTPSLRVIVFGGLGVILILLGVWGLNRTILQPFVRPGRPVLDAVASYRKRERGPRIVVIGGGNGQSTLLRGLKEYTHNLTAIVTVADDGGSSGRLRSSMGILPPGDIRNCLAALSSDEDLISQLFQYRYANGGGMLDGHSFGNLFISALSELTGSFEEAVAESGRVLSVYGQVLPSTLHDVRLVADKTLPHLMGEVRVKGESTIPKVAGEVRRVWLEPNNPPAFPKAIQALLQADMVVVGPGSLYTSILPNLLVPDIIAALRSTDAFKAFVCNVTTQRGETDGYTCWDHIRSLEAHVGSGIFDLVIANTYTDSPLPEGLEWVRLDDNLTNSCPVYSADVADWQNPGKHDSAKLSQLLIDLLMERTGPLAN